MKTLDEYLKNKNCGREGGCDGFPQQRDWYKEQFTKNNFKNVMEIGFNAGHSADLFLSYSDCDLYSFDIGDHDVVNVGKDYIDQKFPNRHNLILGDSKQTISEFAETTDIKFDFILIDGDHSYEGATSDIINCKKLAHEKTILVIDDIRYIKKWQRPHSKPPTDAWLHFIELGVVRELGHIHGTRGKTSNQPEVELVDFHGEIIVYE
jgi:hypothetical protein